METLDATIHEKNLTKNTDVLTESLRTELVQYSKNFKTSWVQLGQNLYSVWRDKLYYTWGYEKFETYTQKELGIKKPLAIKLLKTYFFLEQEEPQYLKKDFGESREAPLVPDCEAVNLLRLAKKKKELTKSDFVKIKRDIFEKGKDASLIRKDLTALIKERKPVDPEEERRERNLLSIRKLMNAIKSFQKDMETLKLIPKKLVDDSKDLLARLEEEAS